MDTLSGRDLMDLESLKDIRIPTSADLFEALENILWFWPSLFVQLIREERERSSDFSLVRAVRLTGQYEGLVVLRTSEDLSDLLAGSLLDDRTASPGDAFNEFSNMFCGHIMNKIRVSEKVSFRHFLPLTVTDWEAPARSPEARMTVAVGKIPLDVQLWIDPSQAASGRTS